MGLKKSTLKDLGQKMFRLKKGLYEKDVQGQSRVEKLVGYQNFMVRYPVRNFTLSVPFEERFKSCSVVTTR
jgi:hypothetical protein